MALVFRIIVNKKKSVTYCQQQVLFIVKVFCVHKVFIALFVEYPLRFLFMKLVAKFCYFEIYASICIGLFVVHRVFICTSTGILMLNKDYYYYYHAENL